MQSLAAYLFALLFCCGSVRSAPAWARISRRDGNGRPESYEAHTIDMPVDHFPDSDRYVPHTNATFKQRYFFDDTYYQPGGPVFLYIGGETSGESRFSNLQTGIIQILMNATNGLGVILENRYYGESYPFETSTTDELRFLTTEQTIADNAYFAQHAAFPGINASLNAPHTPWILYGGSLAGAQTAFSLVEYSGLLWGGIASSGTIHAQVEYPEWYTPIQKYGPQDCISRINAIVDKIDALIESQQTEAIQKVKDIFGLGALEDIRDFAMTIAFPLGGPMNYPTNTWQELNWYPEYDSEDFFWFCGNVTDDSAPAEIKATDYALSNYTNGEPWTGLGGYADYVKKVVVSACPSPDLIGTTECFSTQNESFYADATNSASRSYLYETCNEEGAYQVASKSGPSLILRVLQADYTQQWCTWAFPPGEYNRIPDSPDLSYYRKYGDFNLSAPRLALIDGDVDVWRDLCYHSSEAPVRYGENQYLIAGGGHHWDSYGILDIEAEPDYIREAHKWEIRMVKKWLNEFEVKGYRREKRDEL
ncbi:uncharacterized protein PV09_08318 [Verruconis gallopava]|uniref:Extracelular serine carboxypeptidase n=1 Tax=Verruconis gallopava TaxID=253628 RepID=A0A0D2A1E3_9PEZI|nr:uncharacterized protein PV09_08318 [Verruconis gallopava]KIW00140.1 hypothetical protein PV09_08318 [Verruconis gallopava]